MSELAISVVINGVLGAVLLGLMRWRPCADAARLNDAAAALTQFQSQHPEAVGEVTLAADGQCALVDLKGAVGVGLVQRHARRWNTRVLAPGDVTNVQLLADGRIEVRLADFGWPRVQFAVAADAREAWSQRLRALESASTVIRHA